MDSDQETRPVVSHYVRLALVIALFSGVGAAYLLSTLPSGGGRSYSSWTNADADQLRSDLGALQAGEKIDEELAVRIAVNEVTDTGFDKTRFKIREVEVEKEDFGYRIFVQFYPLTPGGHCWVEVGNDGEVIQYIGGK